MSLTLLLLLLSIKFNSLEFFCTESYHECGPNDLFRCIPKSWICDYNQDCEDNSDEAKCPPIICDKNQYKCLKSDQCISKDQVCDGKNDCAGNDDESQCVSSKTCNEKTEYDCKNNKTLECIPIKEVCNNKINCTTNKDAQENCSVNMCTKLKNPCSHKCINKFSSFVCDCPSDMKLAMDKRTCIHLNKCLETPDVCSQDCKDTGITYNCFCYNGYIPNGNKCTPENPEDVIYLLYSSHKHIYRVPIFDTNYQHLKFQNQIINSSYDILSFDVKFNKNDMVLYSSLIEQKDVLEINNFPQSPLIKDIHEKRTVEMTLSNLTLYSTALDPARNLLFFTDCNSHSISVMNLTSLDKVKIIEKDCYFPYHIVIDPVFARIFWIDLGENNISPRIEMANMDGSYRYTLMEDGLRKPTSLAIDIDEQRLYWADHFPSTIKYIDLKSIRSSMIKTSLVLELKDFLPVSLAVFGNRIYWSDWQKNSICSAHKVSGKNIKLFNSWNRPMNLRIISNKINRQLIKKINENKSAKQCSGLINTCPFSCLPNSNMPEVRKCFGVSPKIKSNNNSLWFILIPVVLIGVVCIVLFKYQFSKTKVVLQPANGNVYIYDNVKFYEEDQNSVRNENITTSDSIPIINNTD